MEAVVDRLLASDDAGMRYLTRLVLEGVDPAGDGMRLLAEELRTSLTAKR